MPSTRRTLLASAGSALAGVAGCLQTRPGDDSEPTSTDRPADSPGTTPPPTDASRTTDTVETDDSSESSTTTAADPGDFEVSFVGHAVQRSAFWPALPDLTRVWSPPDRQLLFAMVTVEGGRPENLPLDRFSLQVDDRTVDHAETVDDGDSGAYRPMPDGCECSGGDRDRPYEYDAYAIFPLPAPLSAEDGEVVREGPERTRTWSLPESALSSLAAPTTTFELREVDAPSSTRPDEGYDVTYEVENVGDERGTARGAVSQEGPFYGVLDTAAEEVAPGESLTRSAEVQYPGSSGESEARLVLSTVGGDEDVTVPVEGVTTTSGE